MRTKVLLLAVCLALSTRLHAAQTLPEGGTCSEDAVRQAVQLLQQCGLDIDAYVAPKPCASVILQRFAVKDASVLAGICQTGVSGRCLEALLDKYAPAATDVEGGLKRLADACRDVNPFCAVSLVHRYQGYAPEQIRSYCPAR